MSENTRYTNAGIDQVADLVRKVCGLEIPLDLDKVVLNLGGTVIYENIDGQISGKCEVHLGSQPKFTIRIQQSESVTRQRFTLAHELGHLLLHTKFGNRKIQQEEYHDDVFHRSQNHDYCREEQEANRFAASLLMPRDLFLDAVARNSKDGACDLSKLAEEFNVSPQAARTRGCYLGMFRWHEQ